MIQHILFKTIAIQLKFETTRDRRTSLFKRIPQDQQSALLKFEPTHTPQLRQAIATGNWDHEIWQARDVEKSLIDMVIRRELSYDDFLSTMIHWTAHHELASEIAAGSPPPYAITALSIFNPMDLTLPTDLGQSWLDKISHLLGKDIRAAAQQHIAHNPAQNVVWRLQFKPYESVLMRQTNSQLPEIGKLIVEIKSPLILYQKIDSDHAEIFIPSPTLLYLFLKQSGKYPIKPLPVFGISTPVDIANSLVNRNRDIALFSPDAPGFNGITHRFKVGHLGVLLHDYLLHGLEIAEFTPREVSFYIRLAMDLHAHIRELRKTGQGIDQELISWRDDLIDMPKNQTSEYAFMRQCLFSTPEPVSTVLRPSILKEIKSQLTPLPYESVPEAVRAIKLQLAIDHPILSEINNRYEKEILEFWTKSQ